MTPAERLSELAAGKNPAFVARLESGYVVMGAYQFFPGYCLLLADPLVPKLNDLSGAARTQFLGDMASVGDAVLRATGCARINYSIYGNLDPFLHAHLWPRNDAESPSIRTLPPLSIPAEIREPENSRFDPVRHRDLLERIRFELLA